MVLDQGEQRAMPLYMFVFGVLLSFSAYVLPGSFGYVTKAILATGVASAGVCMFLVFAPKIATTPLGG